MTFHLHIDRVVIDAAAGPVPDRARLEESIRGELAERLGADGLPARLRASSARDAIAGDAVAGGIDRPRTAGPRARDHGPGAGVGTAGTATPGLGVGHALYGSFNR